MRTGAEQPPGFEHRKRSETKQLAEISGRRQLDAMTQQRALDGRRAEAAVAEYLKSHGYEIVATNLRLGQLEIDVVARAGPVIVVVEVRTRGPGAWTSAFGSIDSKKRQRVRRAGERLWQRRYKHDPSVERLRFDAASVKFDAQGTATIEYVQAAF